MKKSIILLGIAASLLAVSCSKMSPVGESVIKEKVSLGAVLEQQASETKTALSGSTVVWSQGDQLSVLSTEKAEGGDVFTLKEASAGQTSGEFEGDLTLADQYYALYPYDVTAAFASEAVTFPVPATQEYVANGFANGANASIAPFTLATKDNLYFKNVFGVLKLSLKAGGDDITVNSITVFDKSGKAMNGTASVVVSAVESGDPVATVSGGTSNITLNCSSPVTVTSSAAVDFYIVVPAGAFANGFTVTANCTDGYRTVSTTKDNTIHRSYIREMPEIALPAAAETVVDLSVEGTSNCYVVPAVGTYKFLANVKGNGVSVASQTTEIEPKKVKVLWETNNTASAPEVGSIICDVVLDAVTGYISFVSTGAAGNALIAATDDDDQILWSWYIWSVPGMDIYDTENNVLGPIDNDVYILDRQLGALSCDPTSNQVSGCYYLVGRKDPFPGVTNYLSAASGALLGWAFSPEISGTISGSDIDVWTENPTKGGGAAGNTYWGATSTGSGYTNRPKTMQDPCPVGYKVPSANIFTNCSVTSAIGRTVTCKYTPTNLSLGVFPATGLSYGGKSYSYDSMCMEWTSSYAASGKSLYNFAISTTIQTNDGSASNSTCYLPIRCIKE